MDGDGQTIFYHRYVQIITIFRGHGLFPTLNRGLSGRHFSPQWTLLLSIYQYVLVFDQKSSFVQTGLQVGTISAYTNHECRHSASTQQEILRE